MTTIDWQARVEKAEAERDEARAKLHCACDAYAEIEAEASDLKAQVGLLVYVLTRHTIGTSFDENDNPVNTHCYNCNEVWPFAGDAKHKRGCVLDNLPEAARAYSEERGRLVANQRTPGTFEACSYCNIRLPISFGSCRYNPPHGSCPIRTPGNAQEHGG